MKRLCFLSIFICFVTLFAGTGCTDKKVEGADTIDTTEIDTVPPDTLETLLEQQPMPKAADELFDDFFFNFAANRKLQRERTDFPLSQDNFGKKTTIAKNKWQIERFFMKQGYYTLVFNSKKDMQVVKDTSISHVTVEKLMFKKNCLKQWIFNRINGQWRLQAIRMCPLSTHRDASFVKFYNQFATDSAFQARSLADLIHISAPDPEDDFSHLDGDVMPEQWPSFAPWMPKGNLFNICYGDKSSKPSNTRVFVIRGIANGLETELTFKKFGGTWKLVKMEC